MRKTWPTIADFEDEGRHHEPKKCGKHQKATKGNKMPWSP